MLIKEAGYTQREDTIPLADALQQPQQNHDFYKATGTEQNSSSILRLSYQQFSKWKPEQNQPNEQTLVITVRGKVDKSSAPNTTKLAEACLLQIARKIRCGGYSRLFNHIEGHLQMVCGDITKRLYVVFR